MAALYALIDLASVYLLPHRYSFPYLAVVKTIITISVLMTDSIFQFGSIIPPVVV
jgi:hypothetical protein